MNLFAFFAIRSIFISKEKAQFQHFNEKLKGKRLKSRFIQLFEGIYNPQNKVIAAIQLHGFIAELVLCYKIATEQEVVAV